MAALAGVGDVQLGQWIEQGEVAVHVRRRLSALEQLQVGLAVDIRGTAEAVARIQRVAAAAPYIPLRLLMEENQKT